MTRKETSRLFIALGIIAIIISIIVTPSFASKYLSPDNSITSEGLEQLKLYRVLLSGLGIATIFFGVFLLKKAEFTSLMNAITEKLNEWLKLKWVVIGALLLGFALRIIVSLRGHNFDFQSYLIVADLMDRGLNVYANTSRYNYGPIWFFILKGLYYLASRDANIFRYLLIIFLSTVDLGIFFILRKKYGNLAGILFFLNPISIIITGYHNQFDNLAILLGLISILFISDSSDEPIKGRKLISLLLLGLSITTKHILFIFPVWLAIKQKGLFQKILTVFIPIAIFILSFLPFWEEGKNGIIQNVFLYKSFNNLPFYWLFVPASLQKISPQILWVLILLVVPFILKDRSLIDFFLYYTAIMVATSPAIANQYLAIAAPFASVFINPFTVLYTVFSTLYLFTSGDGLYYPQLINLSRHQSNCILIFVLTLGIAYSLWRDQLIKLAKNVITNVFVEVKNQLGIKD